MHNDINTMMHKKIPHLYIAIFILIVLFCILTILFLNNQDALLRIFFWASLFIFPAWLIYFSYAALCFNRDIVSEVENTTKNSNIVELNNINLNNKNNIKILCYGCLGIFLLYSVELILPQRFYCGFPDSPLIGIKTIGISACTITFLSMLVKFILAIIILIFLIKIIIKDSSNVNKSN